MASGRTAANRPPNIRADEAMIMTGIAGNDGSNAKVAAEEQDDGSWRYAVKCQIHFSGPGARFAARDHRTPVPAVAAWRAHAAAMH